MTWNERLVAPLSKDAAIGTWTRSNATLRWPQLCTLAASLRTAVKTLQALFESKISPELLMLQRLFYVNHAQHRSAREYARAFQVYKLLKRMQDAELCQFIRSLIKILPEKVDISTMHAQQYHGPSQVIFVRALERVYAVRELAVQIVSRCACVAVDQTMGIVQGTFLPFRVVLLAAFSRIHSVLEKWVELATSIFDLLRPWLEYSPPSLSGDDVSRNLAFFTHTLEMPQASVVASIPVENTEKKFNPPSDDDDESKDDRPASSTQTVKAPDFFTAKPTKQRREESDTDKDEENEKAVKDRSQKKKKKKVRLEGSSNATDQQKMQMASQERTVKMKKKKIEGKVDNLDDLFALLDD